MTNKLPYQAKEATKNSPSSYLKGEARKCLSQSKEEAKKQLSLRIRIRRIIYDILLINFNFTKKSIDNMMKNPFIIIIKLLNIYKYYPKKVAICLFNNDIFSME